MRASNGKRHISGAEGIYREAKINEVVSSYMHRAFDHVKGQPDSLSIKVSMLKGDPLYISIPPTPHALLTNSPMSLPNLNS